jgi:hypothetical protein
MSNINFSDKIGVIGSVEIIIQRASDGEIVQRIEDSNIVVRGGRSGLAHLWAGQWFSGVPSGRVNEMRFGDRGHDSGEPTLPKSSSIERSQLFCESEGRPVILAKKPLAVDFPDGDTGTTVRFTAVIGAAEGNGTGTQGFSEVGLYRDDGTLAAHKTFGLITKTNEFQITFRWKFEF